ncbi:hypothetical protein [Nocardia blacklockiae]|uniref:hypothetical protein n=1 Tax=Nocardia blacklockiae TaxID=480036 RepID=UPI0018955A32|nr:hypothetical protein [Nocardia blacklockiae]MBF6171091.1 hypothetical protein [Nocardia blacklockiae]
MNRPRHPESTPEQAADILNRTNLAWEEVPDQDVPPLLTDANAAELLRRIAAER